MTTTTSLQVRWTMCRERLPRRRSLDLDHLLFGVIGLTPPGWFALEVLDSIRWHAFFVFSISTGVERTSDRQPSPALLRGEYVFVQESGQGLDYSSGGK